MAFVIQSTRTRQLCSLVAGIMIVLWAVPTTATAAPEAPPALTGCTEMCGEIPIPFPFGISDGCFFKSEFRITCDESTTPPSANLTNTTISITNFFVNEGQLRIMQAVAQDCYDDKGASKSNKPSTLELPVQYTISDRNEFYAVGCNSIARYQGFRILGPDKEESSQNTVTVCETTLGKEPPSRCTLFGCARNSIPDGLHNITVTLKALGSLGSQRRENDSWNIEYPCSYAFIAEQNNFKFSADRSFQQLETTRQMLPVIVNWMIEFWVPHNPSNSSTDEQPNPPDICGMAQAEQNYPCKGNSRCVAQQREFLHYKPVNVSVGYLCQCLAGYEGNPYLGCKDINECEVSSTALCPNGTCVNNLGSYSCECHEGYRRYFNLSQQYCIRESTSKAPLVLIYIVAAGIPGTLFLVIATWWFYKAIKKRKTNKRKQKLYKQNGGLLLEQQLSSGEVNVEKIKLFSSKELEKATDHFNANRVLGEGGQGTVYKGMLTDGRIVAVKKSKVVTGSEIGDFINEIVILSQINHRHVVQLLGCCLETEIPLLVYEYLPNGTLSHYIHHQDQEFPLTWETRLRISVEVAGALSYLHSSASCPIYHRDIKAANILLDDKDRAKVADFGTSRSVSIDHTHLTTLVHGTFGYLDPEYFQSSQFTDKSDVYSFGVVLAELLTGQKPVSTTSSQEGRSLAAHFLHSMEQNVLFHILDDQVINDGEKEVILAVANLARKCLSMKGKKRPTMKEVAVELERIQLSTKDLDHVQQNMADNGEVPTHELTTVASWDVVSTSAYHFTDGNTDSWDVQPLLTTV
ncbi:wall-associated receptor kinase-like 1 [Argentina anserina]|uniref:wall-associated receptor kinase-like 1 n=1 Tax=Argentina anserina TaxID=57926 RepID=UPI002176540F|nr:wall-associated receptor kinase-like 1 [Potentilla anserina]